MPGILWITEYNSPADHSAVKEPAIWTQALAFGVSTQSAVFGDETRCVRLVSDANCHLLFGLNPAATTSHQKLIAGVPELRQVKPGDRLAAVDGV